jgi:hypothetical protein
MNRLRLLHNGDLREDSPAPSAHWMAYVMEDGTVAVDIITRTRQMYWPPEFRASNPAALFDIPAAFRERQLQAHPYLSIEDIIVTLVGSDGRDLCSFIMAELPEDSTFRRALSEVVQRVEEIAEQAASANVG